MEETIKKKETLVSGFLHLILSEANLARDDMDNDPVLQVLGVSKVDRTDAGMKKENIFLTSLEHKHAEYDQKNFFLLIHQSAQNLEMNRKLQVRKMSGN